MKRSVLLFIFYLSLTLKSHATAPSQSPLIAETVFSEDRRNVSLKITNGLPFIIKIPSTTLWNVKWEAWSFVKTESNFELSTVISREFIIDTSEPSSEQKLAILLKKINDSNNWVILKPNESISLPLTPPVEEATGKIKNATGKIDIIYRARVDNILIDSEGYDYAKQLTSMLMTHKTSRFMLKDDGWCNWGQIKRPR